MSRARNPENIRSQLVADDMTHDSRIDGFEPEIYQQAEKLVHREIYGNDSMLITALQEAGWDEFWLYRFENIFDDAPERIEEFLLQQSDLEPEQRCELASAEERKALAESHGFEADYHEIYEYWRISGWLADGLVQLNQPVLRNDYGDWWGRTCSGQAIIMDGTLQQLVRHWKLLP